MNARSVPRFQKEGALSWFFVIVTMYCFEVTTAFYSIIPLNFEVHVCKFIIESDSFLFESI